MKARIDIISGFLGAGKTTLILEMLKAPPAGERIAVCENEFGEVGIDGDVLKGKNLEVVEINAGCVCCTLSFNLISGIKLLVAQYKPTRILLEPTGLAGLADILNVLKDDGLEKVAGVGTAAAVIDGAAMLAGFERYKSYFEAQIASAQAVFVNRADAIGDTERLRLADIIQAINPHAHIIPEPFAPEGIWQALDASSGSPGTAGGLPKAWLRQFKQLSVETGWAGSREKLEELFRGNQSGEIIRAKGYVYDAGGVRFRADLAGGAVLFEPAGEGGPDFVQLIGRNLSVNLIKQQFSHL